MSDTEILELLRRIDKRLERLESRQEKIPDYLKRFAEEEVSILTDSLDELFNPSSVDGIKNLNTFIQVKEILRTLGGEENLRALNQLSKSLKDIAYLTSQLKEIENTISIATDSMDELVAKAVGNGLNLEELARNLHTFGKQLVQLMESGAFSKLIDSGILDNKSIEVVGALGNSLAISRNHKKSIGVFGLVSALFNKDIQRSLGFSVNLATHFGRKLKNEEIGESKNER